MEDLFEENVVSCATCPHWERDGSDGICYGGIPEPRILAITKNAKYTLVWPKTNAEDRCPRHPKVIQGFMEMQ